MCEDICESGVPWIMVDVFVGKPRPGLGSFAGWLGAG